MVGEIDMTQEDKELLLKDLCARLPYGVKVKVFNEDVWLYNCEEGFVVGKESINDDCFIIQCNNYSYVLSYDDFKPYLLPLSSMTEEQRKEFLSVTGYETREEDCGRHTETYYYDMVGHEHMFYPNSEAIDYCNKNHFDYRGLIPKGLAIDATGKNIY